MARIYKTPTKEQVLNGLSEEHRNTINKMLEIQDILIDNPPNDKYFNNNEVKYMLQYISILSDVELTTYSDERLQKAINRLHTNIFKNRRY